MPDGWKTAIERHAAKPRFIVMPGRTGLYRQRICRTPPPPRPRQIPSDRNAGGFWWKRVSDGQRNAADILPSFAGHQQGA